MVQRFSTGGNPWPVQIVTKQAEASQIHILAESTPGVDNRIADIRPSQFGILVEDPSESKQSQALLKPDDESISKDLANNSGQLGVIQKLPVSSDRDFPGFKESKVSDMNDTTKQGVLSASAGQ